MNVGAALVPRLQQGQDRFVAPLSARPGIFRPLSIVDFVRGIFLVCPCWGHPVRQESSSNFADFGYSLGEQGVGRTTRAGDASAKTTTRRSSMKTYLTYAVTILIATMAVAMAAPEPAAMMEKENAAWQAFKDKKTDDFKKYVSANLMAVYADGFHDTQKEVNSMSRWDIKSFALSDYKINSPGPDVVIATYSVKLDGTFDNKDASGMYNSSTVWYKKGKEWTAIFHTNVKTEAAK
jgi:hypothetical protein